MIGFLVRLFTSGIIEKAISAFTKTEDFRIQGKQIDSDTVTQAMRYYVENQKVETTKWSFPWFPLMVAPFVICISLFFITLSLYNVLWHQDGIYPQTWTIADYPGIYKEWASTVFNWIFAPALGVVTLKALIK